MMTNDFVVGCFVGECVFQWPPHPSCIAIINYLKREKNYAAHVNVIENVICKKNTVGRCARHRQDELSSDESTVVSLCEEQDIRWQPLQQQGCIR